MATPNTPAATKAANDDAKRLAKEAAEAEKDEEKEEDKEKSADVAKSQAAEIVRLNGLLEKSVAISEKINAAREADAARIAKLETMLSKYVPPRDQVEWPDGKGPDAVQHDTTASEVDGKPHPDNTVAAGKDTLSTSGAFVKKSELEGTLDAIVAKRVAAERAAMEKQIAERFDAYTPVPLGFTQNDEMRAVFKQAGTGKEGLARAMKTLVQKAVDLDRQNCGGVQKHDNPNSTLSFGVRAGTEDYSARKRTVRSLAKMFHGA